MQGKNELRLAFTALNIPIPKSLELYDSIMLIDKLNILKAELELYNFRLKKEITNDKEIK